MTHLTQPISPMFQPLSIGSMKLKNRFVVSPMVTVYCDQAGLPTEQYLAYHEARAKGGWGLIITEDYAVDPLGRGFWTPGLWEDSQIAPHAELTRRVHEAGANILAQIYHCGRQTSSALIGAQPVSASPLPCPVTGEIPRALTIPEIETLVEKFGDTALRAKKAGFDGVEVHGAHGYLIAQFMSRYSNKRTDRYGGSLERRLRFPLEIIANIRKKCGKDFTVGFRISANEYVEGGRTLAETKAAALILEKAGVDLLHVSAGVYGSAWAIIPPMNIPNAWIVDDAAEVKKLVKIPVITIGRINDPYLAESILLSGKADLIAMGRASLADPELPNKFKEGRSEDIRHCIGCQQGCLEILFRNEPIRCLVNPSCGFESRNELIPTPHPKRITVVGGGPAGLEAARAARIRGHQVTLYEKNSFLGGQFALAAIPPSKGDISSYPAWAGEQLKKLGVIVKLNTPYTADLCSHERPDIVIMAAGSKPARPAIPGIHLPHVVTAEEVLLGQVQVGSDVIVAGGGMIGSETASYLGAYGKNVTIIEMLPEIAQEEETTRKGFLMKMLEEQKVKMLTNCELMEIKESSARVACGDEVIDLPAQTIVLALGLKENLHLQEELSELTEVRSVGDALKTRTALEAIREGFLAGAQA